MDMGLTEADVRARSFTTEINFLAPSCNNPSVHNGDFSRNFFPLEGVAVTMWDADTFASPPQLDAEGFCRVSHKFDLSGVPDSPEATKVYSASLAQLVQKMTGADEAVMHPHAVLRRQAAAKIDKEASVPAGFAHGDVSDSGARESEEYFYAPPSRPGVRRTALLNVWRLLSPSPTNMPLALCDARSVRPEDIVRGPAYFPTIDKTIDTAYYHPNDHFRWVYYSKLNSEEVLVFKQYDSDPAHPSRVPHVAFSDPTCSPGAPPRVSVESRCLLRWYD